MVKVQEVNGRMFVTVPYEKAQRMKLKKGEEMDWNFDQDGNLVLCRVEERKK